MAGIAFTGCGLGHPARAQGQPPRRREVVVAGKRINTIDIHAHCHIPEATALMGVKQNFPGLVVTSDRIKVMDEQGIDIEALSINPNYRDQAERDLAAQVVKLQNEKLAEICAKTPDRALSPSLRSRWHTSRIRAAEQLETAVKKLGLRGALVGGSVNGAELADPKLHPFLGQGRRARHTDLHPPAKAAPNFEKSGRLKGSGGHLQRHWQPGRDVDRAVAPDSGRHIDRFPGLKICAAHAGGYLPSYSGRTDAMCANRPDQCPVRSRKSRANT